MVFHNRRYFAQQKFEITRDALKIEQKNLFEEKEFEIPLEMIGKTISRETIFNSNLFMVGFFFLGVTLLFLFGIYSEISLIFGFFSLLFFVIPFLSRKRVVRIDISYSTALEIFYHKQNKDQVYAFATEVVKASNEYLLKKYSKIDRQLPIEPQLEKIQFLLQRDIINDEAFTALKDELLGNIKPGIGFGKV